MDAALDAISSKHSDHVDPTQLGPSEAMLAVVRDRLAQVLGVGDVGPIATDMYSSPIRGRLLYRWAVLARDLAAEACQWLWEGAPGGIEHEPTEVDGIFPKATDSAAPLDPSQAYLAPEEFSNYKAFDQDEAAAEEVFDYEKKGYLRGFDTLAEVCEFVGGEPVISRFAVLSRSKNGKTNRRLILDLKQSKVTACTRKTHRVVLPRITDAVKDMLEIAVDAEQDEETEWLILDFIEAFWNIPLRHAERKHFVGKAGGRYFVYLRAARGSRNGPLAWASVISVPLRCTQGIFFGAGRSARPGARSPADLRLQFYVDDPASAIRGRQQTRDRAAAIQVVLWRVLGFPFAFHKAQRGRLVRWIGVDLKATPSNIVVSIPADKITELLELVDVHLKSNVISTRDLRHFRPGEPLRVGRVRLAPLS